MPAARLVRSALFSAALASLAATIVPAPVEAQSFFDIFRPRHAPPSSYAPHRGNFFDDFFGIFRGDETDRVEDKAGSGVYANYCVRTCDGKYFPVNRGQRSDVSYEKICKAMCPAAETAIFRGAGIEHATSSDGKKYMSLPNALAYRNEIADNCTCNGRDPFGVVNVEIDEDPTLRTGDFVVKPEQVVVFQGNSSHHTAEDFIPLDDAKNVSAMLRKQLSAIRILQDNPNATFARTMPVMGMSEATAQHPAPEAPNANTPAAEPPARTN